jgi:cytosine/adenosine deaminase-related metal-dependent hydrolase
LASKITYYKSRWVYPVDAPPIENGWVGVSDGKIISLGRGDKGEGHYTDLGCGVILPALINAHTHLELSALKGRIDSGLGFLSWVQTILAFRETINDIDAAEALGNSLSELHQKGIVAVGDWLTSLSTRDLFNNSPITRCGFYEIIGFSGQDLVLPNGMNKNSAIRNPQSAISFQSLGAHAPHTTSDTLLKSAKAWCTAQGLPISIHTAESFEEIEFLANGGGPWEQLLRDRGRWNAAWRPPGMSPVAYLDNLGILNETTQCIHLTRASGADLEIIRSRKARVVICPRSNHFITGCLPPVLEMIDLGITPALGTDSLASNQDLDLWVEMEFLSRIFPSLNPEMILQMTTMNGAVSLGLEKLLGSITPDKKASMLFLPLPDLSLKDLPAAIIESKGKGLKWITDGLRSEV